MVAIGIIALLVLWLYRKLNGGTSTALSSPGVAYGCHNTAIATYPLHLGSDGYQVELLQRIYNSVKYDSMDPLDEDGIWGTKTQRAFATWFGKSSFTEAEFNSWLQGYLLTLQNSE